MSDEQPGDHEVSDSANAPGDHEVSDSVNAPGDHEVSDSANAPGNPEIEAIARIAQAALNTAQTAHAKATDALDTALNPPVNVNPSMTEELLQEVVDFLHRLFPGHGAPGTPSAPPAA